MDSKQGGVHGQKQATLLVCRQRKRKHIGTLKECNKKYKLTQTSFQNSEVIRTYLDCRNSHPDIIQSRAAHSKQGGVNVKTTRISVLVFPFIDLFGVFINKARTPVLAEGSLELIVSLAVLAFKTYLRAHGKQT